MKRQLIGIAAIATALTFACSVEEDIKTDYRGGGSGSGTTCKGMAVGGGGGGGNARHGGLFGGPMLPGPGPQCLPDPPPGDPSIEDQLVDLYTDWAEDNFGPVCQGFVDMQPVPPPPDSHVCEPECASVGGTWHGDACGFNVTVTVMGGVIDVGPCMGGRLYELDAYAEADCGCECL